MVLQVVVSNEAFVEAVAFPRYLVGPQIGAVLYLVVRPNLGSEHVFPIIVVVRVTNALLFVFDVVSWGVPAKFAAEPAL